MSGNLKDILSSLSNDIDQEKLLQYLSGQLPAAEQHELEQQLNDDPFLADAVEGLQSFKNSKEAELMAYQLNTSLKKQLTKKEKRRKKRSLPDQTAVYYAVVILLLLVVIAYVVIKRAISS
ncbi:MAG: hypothetical protein WAT19_11315 [Ferruginibacter sp.]